ncbi:YhgE/Pip domain-containing protein [Pontibacillus sp. HMF3514]|uniref:YhgE/Pip domain-containing protein n=1 Tax=Pontibacillus sp. HMF3514 TaxID=2692425 RepID=UPI0013201A72|nr:YhgE/Pip domain-containing protein [Pontibacillus sp. HMF3514]QHE50938.1 YhgE/Pip domain-containing protein [Pontibacillus sp. HMF3514]
MKFKRIIAVFMAFLLVMPSFLVSAEKNDSSSEDTEALGKGSFSEKHEVVYAKLNATGDQQEMYVVNNFNIKEPGKIVDYGPYMSVQNLTDLTKIEQNNGRIELTAKEDEFYYQGDLEDQSLPWDINVSYTLNGETLTPEELLGKDGGLKIQIDTAQNKEANPIFFNNYLLQITLKLDSKIYENMKAPNGTVVNAGKDRQVTFTVMPEKQGSFTLTSDVTDFEMESIEFAAIPSSMSIDKPDVGEMKKDMNSLSDATSEINKGVGELKNGITELNNGVASLYNGSEQYKNGINELSNGSADLVEGSASIHASLQQMSESINKGSSDMNLSDFKKMEDGLRQLAGGLKETEKGLTNLEDQYSQSQNALSQSIESIPASNISEKDIQALYKSGADQKVVDQLVETYKAAQKTKKTYESVKEAFNAVGPALEKSAGSLNEMSASLTTMADNLGNNLENMNVDQSMKELQKGLQALSSNYNDFHSGLKNYTNGVNELSTSYSEIHGGIAELTKGTQELENGSAELHNGTSELASSTSDLPEQMQKEIDQMVNEFDKSDFDPVSFVSTKNEKVTSVQFVIKTESIKKVEEKEEEPQEKEKQGFWDRLLALFR